MRGRAFPALVAALVLAVGPALAATPDRLALFVDALRDNGCSMTEAEADAQLPALGLTIPEVVEAVTLLSLVEAAVFTEAGALVLAPDWCEGADSLTLIEAALADAPDLEPWEPAFTPEQGAVFVAAVRDNGCTMTEDQAGDILPPLGLTMTVTRDVVNVMFAGGLAAIAPDGTLMLSPMLCEGDAAADAETLRSAREDFLERVR